MAHQEKTAVEQILFPLEPDGTLSAPSGIDGLSAPKLLFQSVQVKIDAGRLPRASKAGAVRYLRIPINVFRPDAAEEIALADR